VVVVDVCAPATAYDIARSRAAPREVRGLLRRVTCWLVLDLLELPNILVTLPESCGSRDASIRDVVRRQDRENSYVAATMENQRERRVVSTLDADWQRRNEDAALR
jgi:hypothetical protein